jgi:hypothetical protein
MGSSIPFALSARPRSDALTLVCGAGPEVCLAEELLAVIARHDDGSPDAALCVAAALGWVIAVTQADAADVDGVVSDDIIDALDRTAETASYRYRHALAEVYRSIRACKSLPAAGPDA